MEYNKTKKHRKNNIITKLPYQNSNRKVSWITLDQIDKEYPEFVNMLSEILFFPKYNEKMKNYVRGILGWLELWKFISWKQFDSCFRIYDYPVLKRNNNFIYKYKDIISIKSNNLSFSYKGKYIPNHISDKEIDVLHKKIFGFRYYFPEETEEGLNLYYDSKGNRFFGYKGSNKMEDYISSKIIL